MMIIITKQCYRVSRPARKLTLHNQTHLGPPPPPPGSRHPPGVASIQHTQETNHLLEFQSALLFTIINFSDNN